MIKYLKRHVNFTTVVIKVMRIIKVCGFFYLCLIFFSCKVDPKIKNPITFNNLAELIPQGWPQPYYTYSTNVVSENVFILGRALFYEELLSKDNSISCGSCHQNFTAFANADHALSHGINGNFGTRNTPGLFNLAWHPYFMHDGGINHIELQPLAPISNPIEMDENINHVIAKLQSTEKYLTLFKNAFGNEEINSQKLLLALTQFQGLIYSFNSKYDRVKRKEKNEIFTESEAKGYQLFQANCTACHKEPLFSDFQFRSIGLPIDQKLKDSGRAVVEKLQENIFKFKTPSLRNIALTFPYMHDGRFNTLEQCLDHYTNGITNLINLDPLLTSNGMNINHVEKNDIINFLHTLTDTLFIKDNRFSDPNN